MNRRGFLKRLMAAAVAANIPAGTKKLLGIMFPEAGLPEAALVPGKRHRICITRNAGVTSSYVDGLQVSKISDDVLKFTYENENAEERLAGSIELKTGSTSLDMPEMEANLDGDFTFEMDIRPAEGEVDTRLDNFI